MTIIKRADLGRPLTWDELDDNFQQVDNLTAAASAAVSSASAAATSAAGSAVAAANSATAAAGSAADAANFVPNAVQSTLAVLEQPDGLRHIGRCQDIATLRTVEPTNQGQKIEVVSYYNDWAATAYGPVGGGEFYYDSSDTTTDDDGIFTFVTAGGARWKRVINTGEYSIEFGGCRPGDDIVSVVHTLRDRILQDFLDKKTTATVPVDYDLASIIIPAGNYIVSECITLYTMTPIFCIGRVTFNGRGVSEKAIFCVSHDTLSGITFPKYLPSCAVISGTHQVAIVGSQRVPGFMYGNTVANRPVLTGRMLENVDIRYVSSFIECNGLYDTYLCTFKKVSCYLSTSHGIHFSATNSVNSGERNSFEEVNIGGCGGNSVHIKQSGLQLSLISTSIDFASGDGIHIEDTASYVSVDVSGGSHAEAIDGYFIYNTSFRNLVTWKGGQWLPTNRTGAARTNYQGRHLVYGDLNTIKLRDVLILNTAVADGESVYIGKSSSSSYLDATGCRDSYGLVGSSESIANAGSDMSKELEGFTFSSTNMKAVSFQKPDDITFWYSGLTAKIAKDDDNNLVLQLVPNTEGLVSNYLNITTVDYMPVIPGKSLMKVWGVGQKLSADLRFRIQCNVKWYDSNKTLISTTTSGGITDIVTNSKITTSPSYSTDATVNGKRKLATYVTSLRAPAGAVFAKPYWLISGVDKTVNVTRLACAIEG